MNKELATQKAAELTELTGVYHSAVRDSGDWFQSCGWHVESSNNWGEKVDA